MILAKLNEYIGEEIEFHCWLMGKRSSGSIHFLMIRDGSAFCQVIASKENLPDDKFNACDHLQIETALKIKGLVVKESRSKLGFEIHLKDFTIISEPSEEYPIPRKPSGPDFLLTKRHLWIRSPKQAAIMRIRSNVIHAVREFLDKNEFFCVDTPIFTAAAGEGTTTLFKVDYFNNDVFLAQTGQLYNEATALALEKVYCFGPSFRAEKSKTRRHLTEFWQVEPEFIFADLDSVIKLAQDMIVFAIDRVLDKCQTDLKILERDVSKLQLIKSPFPQITYSEAVEILKKKGFNITWGDDFGAPEETEISSNFSKPVCVHRYPIKIKAFYMKEDPSDNKLALGVDFLAPEGYGEIVGGGIREENLKILEKRIENENLPKEDFLWYLDLRKFGSVPHGGFGLGIERTVAWICGIHHIRECIAFPRTIDRVRP